MADWKEKNVLITGGAGFVGSHLAEALLERGANITILDNFAITLDNNIAHLRERVRLIDHDVTGGGLKFQRYDCIYHLAALAAPNQCEKYPTDAFRVNVQGTFNIFKSAVASGVGKVVFPSSALIYGTNPKYIPIDEKHPISATENVYCITKKLGEDLCRSFEEEHSLPITVLRLFNTFGPRQTPDYLIPTIIRQAMDNGVVELWSDKPTRDFNFVHNTISALIAVGESDLGGDIYNVGSGEEISIREIAETISSEFDAKLNFLNKEVIGSIHLRCDNSRMKEVFGWRPSVSFREGLARTIKWYKEYNNAVSAKGDMRKIS